MLALTEADSAARLCCYLGPSNAAFGELRAGCIGKVGPTIDGSLQSRSGH